MTVNADWARSLLLYVLTDDGLLLQNDWEKRIESALIGGATSIQLRAKHLDAGVLYHKGLVLRDLCRDHGAMFFVNDRLDLALALEADGLHLGQDDLPLPAARRIAGSQLKIGVSAKTVSQARKAIEQGADYLGSGSVFASRSKPSSKVIGLHGFKKVAELAFSNSCPVVAIGGIQLDHVHQLLPLYRHGFLNGVAVISSVLHAEDPAVAARSFRDLFATVLLDDSRTNSTNEP